MIAVIIPNIVSNEEYSNSEHVSVKVERNNIIRKASSVYSETNSLGSKAVAKEVDDEYDLPSSPRKQACLQNSPKQKQRNGIDEIKPVEHTFGKSHFQAQICQNDDKSMGNSEEQKWTPIYYKEVLNTEEGGIVYFVI